MKKNKVRTVLLFSILGVLVIAALLNSYFKTLDLKTYGIILNGKITDVIAGGYRSSSKFRYSYVYNKIEYYDEGSTQIKEKTLFIGKIFPIIFSPKTKNSELLMGPKDFEKYGIQFPDSLRWVLEYKKN
jgi:hypothetical protein